MPRKPSSETYDLHPSIAMMENWFKTLPEKTGRSYDQWMTFIRKEGPKEKKALIDWLKAKHKQGTNTAWWFAERALAAPGTLFDDDPAGYMKLAPKYVADQYAGKKAPLKPIFDRLLSLGRGLASDVKVCPCKTIVPLYRNHVFAQLKPSTNTRVDLGLSLTHHKGKLPSRIIDTGGAAKKDRITHRIPISSVDEIDDDVKKWMQRAYDLDA
jgi:hypothetical protein